MKQLEYLEITVPKDMCPLDFLAEQEEKLENAWLFMDQWCLQEVEKQKGTTGKTLPEGGLITGNDTHIIYRLYDDRFYTILAIQSPKMVFHQISGMRTPDYIIRLEME